MKTRILTHGATVMLAFAACMLATGAGAQTMYRCGSVYQDRPCDAGQKEKAVGRATGTGPAGTASSTGASDADCRQRGQDSLVIVYAWEGGATADRQVDEINRKSISASRKAAERQLVEDVYRQRGTSSQVRARIEAECMKEKEEKAKAAALADALMKSGVKLEPAPPAAGAAPAGPGAQPGVQTHTTSDADDKKKLCDRLKSDLARINSQQRAGGSGATMDRLRERERETAEKIRTGC